MVYLKMVKVRYVDYRDFVFRDTGMLLFIISRSAYI